MKGGECVDLLNNWQIQKKKYTARSSLAWILFVYAEKGNLYYVSNEHERMCMLRHVL
jgi:hypothetical protein